MRYHEAAQKACEEIMGLGVVSDEWDEDMFESLDLPPDFEDRNNRAFWFGNQAIAIVAHNRPGQDRFCFNVGMMTEIPKAYDDKAIYIVGLHNRGTNKGYRIFWSRQSTFWKADKGEGEHIQFRRKHTRYYEINSKWKGWNIIGTVTSKKKNKRKKSNGRYKSFPNWRKVFEHFDMTTSIISENSPGSTTMQNAMPELTDRYGIDRIIIVSPDLIKIRFEE